MGVRVVCDGCGLKDPGAVFCEDCRELAANDRCKGCDKVDVSDICGACDELDERCREIAGLEDEVEELTAKVEFLQKQLEKYIGEEIRSAKAEED